MGSTFGDWPNFPFLGWVALAICLVVRLAESHCRPVEGVEKAREAVPTAADDSAVSSQGE